MTGTSRWLSRHRDAQPAAVTLYCFPHSGATTAEYLQWTPSLPGLSVHGVNLPGRGARFDEAPLTTMPTLVRALADEVRFEAPCVFFGHSLGAFVAYETARELRRRGRELPGVLVLSAAPAPHVPRTAPRLSDQPDARLLAEIGARYGGLPPGLAADPDLLQLVLPPLRADLAILEDYAPGDTPPIDVPFVAVGGDRDGIGRDDLRGWARHTSAGCRTVLLPGGHFYFRDDPTGLLDLLRQTVPTAAGTLR
ncbi:thioesterase II family protein [Catenuloplanes indicus]|uniref:Surfactin synthase thioesterase subunit n=1 Tax=Catenuloplanes indicus TaxID=137267 RepID=A0AAE3W9Y3_9ACTN|nr:alpha/beta fold hydrolase [Catenuloplanes indicus]MDQ0371185.1 surfactin synthase thioesterase subunit [Catenuloplanes indicus]